MGSGVKIAGRGTHLLDGVLSVRGLQARFFQAFADDCWNPFSMKHHNLTYGKPWFRNKFLLTSPTSRT